MKELSLAIYFSSAKDQEQEITLGELFGNKKFTKNSKIRLKVGEHEGSYGSTFFTAEVQVVK